MEYYKQPAHELVKLLERGEISSVELTQSFQERIAAVEPKIDGYLTLLGKKALDSAAEVDKLRAEGKAVGLLAGIPYALKDNVCTNGILTTCASKMLANFVPPYDATIYVKLKQSQAVLLGKANMDEYAMGSSTENSGVKTTKNPHDISRVPGGSSGGSAALTAADEAVFAIGSDTGGSIRQPASLCGVVGMKPTYGRVSRYGIVAFASSLDQIGPITKDVTDCALVLSVISGGDKHDASSLSVDVPNYSSALSTDMKGMRIGLPKEYFGEGISKSTKDAVLKAAKEYEKLGAYVEECSLPRTEYALSAYYIISSAEACSNLARYDGVKYGHRAKDYSDLVSLYMNSRSEGFGSEVKRRIMLGAYALSSGYYDAYYKKAQQVRTLLMQDFSACFAKYDVLLTPTSPITAWEFGNKSHNPIEMYAADICTVSTNIAGLPGISLPCGADENALPIGMQLMGKPLSEQTLLNAAYAYEQNVFSRANILPKL